MSDEPEAEVLLSPRECEVLTSLGQGLTIDQTASALGIKRVTVDLHIKNAKQKLNANTREHALVTAIQRGFISP